MNRVLCLDLEPRADLPPFQGSRWLPAGTEAVNVKAVSEAIPASAVGFTHLLLSGSTYSILDDRPIVEPTIELIRDAVRHRIPIMGICYGHQMIVRALLGIEHVRRAESPEMGWLPVTYRNAYESQFAGLPNPFHVFCGHFDEVWDLPQNWIVLAHTDKCAVQAVINRRLRVFGTQFHPEMDIEIGNQCFLHDRIPLEKRGFDVDAIIANAREDGSSRLIAKFVEMWW